MPAVLCIDDSRDGLATRKRFLEIRGFSVLTATDGQIGLDLMAWNQIHAVVLDYRMPALSGEGVARKIKSRWPSIPIIMLSGYPQVPESAKNFTDAFVVKGTALDLLFSELDRLIGFRPVPNAITAVERRRKKIA